MYSKKIANIYKAERSNIRSNRSFSFAVQTIKDEAHPFAPNNTF